MQKGITHQLGVQGNFQYVYYIYKNSEDDQFCDY